MNAWKTVSLFTGRYSYAALFGAIVITLGFIPVPLTDRLLPRPTWLEYCIAIAPAVPSFMHGLRALGYLRIPALLALVLALTVVAVGGLATLFLSVFSGGGAKMVAMHGTALTIAISSSILMGSVCGRMTRRISFTLFLFPVFLGLWSLLVVPVAFSKASKIAADRPFCIAAHNRKEREVTSLFGLRGFTFYTTMSGHKLGDSWYFHGLLLVADGDGPEVFNWSPRSMGFHRVEESRHMIVRPHKACRPRAKFLQNLPLI